VRRRWIVGGVAAVVAVVLAGAALAAAHAPRASAVTLTLWHNYGTEGNAIATKELVAAFEKQNPSITIKVVSQPAANYFALLQTSGISHTGPDLAVMWTGLFDLKYAKLLTNLKPYLSAGDMARINGAKWVAPNFDLSQGLLVMPLENQFYMGYYNKALFKKAGLSGPPRNWTQLYAACAKLKAAGVPAPIVYGADPQAIQNSPYPWYDMSYLMGAVLSPDGLKGLYTGKTPWTSPAVVAQVTKWAQLPKKGCTNDDVLTKTNILGAFIKGQAGMIVDGNWDAATLQKAMGRNVAAFVPPFSDKAQQAVVQYSGDGFSLLKDSKHQKEGAAFLKFLLTPQASKIIAAAGLIPDIKGSRSKSWLTNSMLDFAARQHMTAYPMLDNVTQGEVVTTGSKQLDDALGGNISALSALKSMKATLDALPSSRKGPVYSG
jgi:ABC-type glycerol-3-phosphate transport system substrate-binding protein